MSPEQTNFLTRGSQTYVKALIAIEAFDSAVESICKSAYKRHEQKLLDQMGLDRSDCQRHCKNSPENREARVGVSSPVPKAGPGARLGFYIYLWWRETDSDTPEIMGAIVLEVSAKKVRDEIRDRFRRESPGCRVETGGSVNGWGLMLKTPITLDELANTADVLDRLIEEWLGYCESAGGIKLGEMA